MRHALLGELTPAGLASASRGTTPPSRCCVAPATAARSGGGLPRLRPPGGGQAGAVPRPNAFVTLLPPPGRGAGVIRIRSTYPGWWPGSTRPTSEEGGGPRAVRRFGSQDHRAHDYRAGGAGVVACPICQRRSVNLPAASAFAMASGEAVDNQDSSYFSECVPRAP